MAKHDNSSTEPATGPSTPSSDSSAIADKEPTVATTTTSEPVYTGDVLASDGTQRTDDGVTATPDTDAQRSDPAAYPSPAASPAEVGKRDTRESKPKARRGSRAYAEGQQAALTAIRERNGWTWAELALFLEDGGDALNVDEDSIDWVREQALSDPSRPTGDPWGNQPDTSRVPVDGDVKDNYRKIRRQTNATWQEMADDALGAGAHQSLIDWMLAENAEDSSRPQDRDGDEPERGPLAIDIQAPPPLAQQVPSRVPNVSPDAAVGV